jgi:hypothetical protein
MRDEICAFHIHGNELHSLVREGGLNNNTQDAQKAISVDIFHKSSSVNGSWISPVLWYLEISKKEVITEGKHIHGNLSGGQKFHQGR